MGSSTSRSDFPTELLDGHGAAGSARRRRAVARAGELLRAGELVVIPTETVYGLAASACDSAAVRAIFVAKERPQDNPLIVHLESAAAALELCPPEPAAARVLLEAFAPGPITVVVPADGRFAPEINSGLETVAIRVPALPIAREVIADAGVPLAAPSANRSGRPSPTSAAMALAEMTGRVAAVLDGGPCAVGIESTVVDASVPGELRILRPGRITAAQIERVVGYAVDGEGGAAAGSDAARRSPGTRYRHYTPRVPVVSVAPGELDSAIAEARERRPTGEHAPIWVVRVAGRGSAAPPSDWRTGSGLYIVELVDYEEYARLLFALFWGAEEAGAAMILAEEPDPRRAPGLADRLSRASLGRYPPLPVD